LFLPRACRDEVIGDLVEEFDVVLVDHGVKKARFWFWSQVLRSLWPFVRRFLYWTFALQWLVRRG
jgi:hypothetical protein